MAITKKTTATKTAKTKTTTTKKVATKTSTAKKTETKKDVEISVTGNKKMSPL